MLTTKTNAAHAPALLSHKLYPVTPTSPNPSILILQSCLLRVQSIGVALLFLLSSTRTSTRTSTLPLWYENF